MSDADGDTVRERSDPAAPGVGDGGLAAEAPERGLLVLRLGEAEFGLWVDQVLEIVETPPISRLPLAHGEVAGVTSVRGELVPVLDLGVRLLGTPAARPGRLALVRHDETVVGLLVDDVETIVPTRDRQLGEPPSAAGVPDAMVEGVLAADDRVVTVLNLGRAAAPPRADSNEVATP